jgi:hypothetical protein
MKYFDPGTTDYAINISDILSRHVGTRYMVKDMTDDGMLAGTYRLNPLVVLVDATPPSTGCDAYASGGGNSQKYGVKYDKPNNILYIYDGDKNSKIEDPIVLEKRPSNGGGGGGGGGGCNAGAGGVALIALAGVALARRSRG